MAPTKCTPKAGKSPSKAKEPKESDLKKHILFLWACHKLSDVQIDIPTVAKHFGITNHAARMRLERLGKKLDKMEASTNSTKSDEETHVKDKAQTKKQTEVNTDEGDTMSD